MREYTYPISDLPTGRYDFSGQRRPVRRDSLVVFIPRVMTDPGVDIQDQRVAEQLVQDLLEGRLLHAGDMQLGDTPYTTVEGYSFRPCDDTVRVGPVAADNHFLHSWATASPGLVWHGSITCQNSECNLNLGALQSIEPLSSLLIYAALKVLVPTAPFLNMINCAGINPYQSPLCSDVPQQQVDARRFNHTLMGRLGVVGILPLDYFYGFFKTGGGEDSGHVEVGLAIPQVIGEWYNRPGRYGYLYEYLQQQRREHAATYLRKSVELMGTDWQTSLNADQFAAREEHLAEQLATWQQLIRGPRQRPSSVDLKAALAAQRRSA